MHTDNHTRIVGCFVFDSANPGKTNDLDHVVIIKKMYG